MNLGEIQVMKKNLKYILVFVILIIAYIGGGKLLDKLYLDGFDINDFTGSTRFTTVNKVMEARYKKADTAILVNTENIDEVVSIAPYAYLRKIPVFYVEGDRVLSSIYKGIERLRVKNIILVGGVNSLREPVERSLVRNGYKVERIISNRGINTSLEIADKMNDAKKVDEIMVVSDNEFDLPNAISFSPYAQKNNIPIIVMKNSDDDVLKLKNFVDKNKIKKMYIVGNNGFLNTNIDGLTEKTIKISGEDRFEVNRKIIDDFYPKSEKIYISKGGELMHKRHLASGQLVNAMAISPLAADNNSPLMYIENNYFSSDEETLIKKKGYKQINEVGFKIERRAFFNVERFKNFTTVLLIIMSMLIAIKLLKSLNTNDVKTINK